MTPIVCPKCEKDDKIQKVSAIYAAGVTKTNYQQPVSVQTENGTIYGNLDKVAVNYTELAKRLAPPEKPEVGYNLNSLGCGFLVMIAVFSFIALMITGDGNNPLILVFGLGIPLVISFLLYKFIFKPSDLRYEEKMKQWNIDQRNWSELYFCSRDDCVFNPSEGIAVAPEKMNILLHVGDSPEPVDMDDRIRWLLKKGQKAEAIKIYRQQFRTGLVEAKEYVEEIERKM